MMIASIRQLPLELPHYPALGRDDFLVSDCNRDALLWVQQWPDWPAPGLCLYGPAASGKSHLAAVWRQQTGADLLDAAALQDWRDEWLRPGLCYVIEHTPDMLGVRHIEEHMFHLFNHCRAEGGSFLMTGRTAPSTWGFAIPDLGSRVRACPAVAIGQPDDVLLAGLMLKLFSDRQLRIEPDVMDYILPRIERSFNAIVTMVDQLDHLSLAQKKPIGIAMARQIMQSGAA